MRRNAKKVTFSLDQEVIEALRTAVASGAATSQNALVERALWSEIKELRRRERRRLWEQAARDPRFLKDLEEISEDFEAADADTARRIL